MQLPITISNIHGEVLTFLRFADTENGKVVEVENEVQPNAGPPMHTHWKQDESITVVSGKLGYQVAGGQKQYLSEGETIVFKRGTAHKFWNAGTGTMRCKGWVSPPDNLIYFLSEIYKSMNENGGRPGSFDAAYLLDRYKSEYAMNEIPSFVQKVIFPITLFMGKLSGKHKKYSNAPQPLK